MRNHARVVLLAGTGLFLGNVMTTMADLAPAWVWGLATLGCVLGVALTYVPEIRGWLQRHAQSQGDDTISRRSTSDTSGISGFLAFLVVAGTVIAVFVWVIPPRPTYVWTHPTLSEAQQQKIKAECRMRALEIFGAGHLGSRDEGRSQYTSECLTSQGFAEVEVLN